MGIAVLLLLTIPSQFVAWLWNLDENLCKAGCLFVQTFSFPYIYPDSPQHQQSGTGNNFDCSRHFGKENTAKSWLTQKEGLLLHEGVNGGMKWKL